MINKIKNNDKIVLFGKLNIVGVIVNFLVMLVYIYFQSVNLLEVILLNVQLNIWSMGISMLVITFYLIGLHKTTHK